MPRGETVPSEPVSLAALLALRSVQSQDVLPERPVTHFAWNRYQAQDSEFCQSKQRFKFFVR